MNGLIKAEIVWNFIWDLNLNCTGDDMAIEVHVPIQSIS